MHDNIKKNVIKELVEHVTETSFTALAAAAGFPALVLTMPLVKGLVLGLLENCYNDCSQKTLSVRETKKLERATTVDRKSVV